MNKFYMASVSLALCGLALIGGAAAFAEDTVKAPSAQAICGYQWRNSDERKAQGGREAWLEYQRTKCAPSVNAQKKRDRDDAVKQWLDAHPVGDKTEVEEIENMQPWQEAKRGKR